MVENSVFTLAEILVTYWVHSSLFIGAALIALRAKFIRFDQLGEWLLKSAMLIGIVTCLISVFIGSPFKSFSAMFDANLQVSTATRFSVNKSAAIHASAGQPTPITQSPVKTFSQPGMKDSDTALNATAQPIKAREQLSNQSFDVTAFSIGLVLVWFVGIIFLVTARLVQSNQLKRLLSTRIPVTNTKLNQIFTHLIRTSGIKGPIRLSESELINSPLVFSSNEVLVPCAMIDSLSVQQCEAALGHELAHLLRRDIFWLKLGLVVETLCFIQPLNKILNRELHQMAEQRSDLLATQWTGNARALVEALSVTAHNNFQSSQNKMVFAMKSQKSHLLKRVENLLQHSGKKTSHLSLVSGAFLTLLVMLLAPGLSIQPVNAQAVSENIKTAKAGSHMHVEDNGKQHFRMSSQTDDITVKIEAELNGKLKFNDEETDISTFPEKSKFTLFFDDGDIERKLKIERGTGDIEYRYYEDSDKKAFDNNAKSWFASVIPTVLRMTGLNAKERVARIKSKYGEDGVLDEVELIQSDHVSGLYLHHLLSQSQLSDKNVLRVVALSKEIGSDYEQAKVLKELVATQELKGLDLWLTTLSATTHIGSDFEQAGVLKAFIPQLPENKEIQEKYFEVAGHIGSDFEMKNVFADFMKEQQFGDDGLIAMFSAAKKIGSDFELSSLLVEAAERVETSSEVFDAYIDLSESIGSDFEMHRAFSELLKTNISKKHLIKMIETASDQIGSDHELAKLLVKIIMRGDLDSDIEAAIRSAVKSIGSHHERGGVLERLYQQKS